MSGLIVLVVLALWAGLGFALWKILVRPRIRSIAALWAVTAGLVLLWFVGPVADEILGAREFEKLCNAKQRIEFFGPVSIGVGRFFHENGTPTWSSEHELQLMPLAYWDEVFVRNESKIHLVNWPMPIFDLTEVSLHSATKQPVVIAHYVISPGGWIKRWSGWGSHAPYQCDKPMAYPAHGSWIKF